MKQLFKKIHQIPKFIPLILILIATIGFIILYSAAGGHIDPWAKKQMIRFGFGFCLLVVIALTDLRIWITLSYPLYIVALLLLVGVEVMGKIGMGAQRWIDLYIFPLQPSEIMKITLLMALARYFHTLQLSTIRQFSTLIIPFCLMLIPAALVLRQPDLGTTVLLVGAGFSIFFIAGIALWVVGLIVGGAVVSIPILWNFLHGYQKERILTFLDPERDPLRSGYHILQSKIAIGSGSIWGKGFGAGSQSHLNFLPEKQTDFIFAMLCEEFGMMAGLILIGLYSILLIYGFKVAYISRNAYGRFLSVGLTMLTFLYVFVNIAMVMGLVPVVGVPLPLVSYGGTALLTMMITFGLLFSIDIHREHRMIRA